MNKVLAKQIAFTEAAGKDMTPKQREWLAANKPKDQIQTDNVPEYPK